MTSNFQFGLSGSGPQLQLGKDGNIIASDSGIVSMYLGDGATYAILRAAYPSGANDVATQQYVMDNLQGLTVKASVTCATNSNITLSGLQTIDGYTTLAGDRVLVKSQTNATQNGIYIAESGAWFRSPDASTGAELVGAFTFVENGNTHAASGWVVATPPPIVVGVTNIVWSQFSGSGSYSAGSGLTLTGSQFSVNTSGVTTGIAGDDIVVLSSSTAGQVLLSTGTSSAEATWGALDLTNSSALSGVLSVSHGGTGVANITANGVVFGQGLNGISATAAGTSGQVLLAGVGGTPTFGSITLSNTTSVTGVLALANGGTNASLTSVAGAVAYSTASAIAFTAAGTSGQVLTSSGSGTPTWSPVITGVSGAANLGTGDGTLFVSNVSGTLGFRNIKSGSSALTVTVSSDDVVVDVSQSNITLTNLAGTLGVTQGGTGLNSVGSGSILYTTSNNVFGTSLISSFGRTLIAGTSVPAIGSSGQFQYNSSGSIAGSPGLTYATSGSLVTVSSQIATDVPLTITGVSSQSGNYLNVLDSSSNNKLLVDANGNVVVGSAALSTTATNGFLYFPSTSGTPTGTPASYSGRTPIVIDTGNNSLYFYNSGWHQLSGTGSVTSVSNSDGSLTISPTTGAVVASLNLANSNTWTAQQNYTANLSVPSGKWLYFNGASDTNWRIGILDAFTTSHVGATTSIQLVTGQGTGGPDGFAIGQTGGASIFEIVGYTKAAYFTGTLSIAGNLTASGTGNSLGTITSGTWNGSAIGIAYGGTGQTTQQAAINALTGTQTSGHYLRSDGTNATLSAIQVGDVPTLNQNTTGTAALATQLTTTSTASNAEYYILFGNQNNTSVSNSASTNGNFWYNPGTATLNVTTISSNGYVTTYNVKLNGATSGTVSIDPQATTGTYNFNLPIAAGSANTYLTSQGGGSTAMTWTSSSGILDQIGATQGDVLYRGASGWVVLAPGTSGQFLQTQGGSANPIWASPSGTGTVNSGTAGQIAYYASSTNAVSGNADMTISAGALTLGIANSVLGTLSLNGATSGTILIQPQAVAGTYNFNLPTTAGTSGYVLTSGGGTTAPMTWTQLAASATTDTTNATNISSGTLSSGILSGSYTGITGVGTVTAGTWNGTVISPTYGGTGVNNGSSTITLGGSLTTSGSFSTTLTVTGNTSITLPTSGTLLTANQTITLSGDVTGSGTTAITTTLATVNSNTGSFGSSTAIPTFTVNGKGLITAASTNAVIAPAGTLSGTTLNSTVVSSSLTSVGTITSGAWNGSVVGPTYGGTGVNNGASTITIGGNLSFSGAFTFAATLTANTNITFPTSGTLLTGNQTITLSGDVTGSGATSISTTVAKINGATLGTTTATSGNILVANGLSAWTSVAMSGDATIVAGGTLTLATVNSNTGSFGSSTAIPTFTVNGKGLITAASTNAVIAPAGTLSGTTLNSTVVSSSLTSVGTIGTGTWQGTVISPTYGGTGVNNGSNTLTLGGSVTYSGAHSVTWTTSGTTTLTLPTSGTLLTANQTITLSGDVTGSGSTAITTTVAKINGATLGTTTATAGNVLVASSGNAWTSVALSGDAAITSTGFVTVASTGGVAFAASATTDTTNASNISSGSLALGRIATISSDGILSNISGSSAAPSANNISAIMDHYFGTTQGAIIYRNSSNWTALNPGTSGYFLQTQGGSSNPQWAAQGSAGVTSITGDGTIFNNSASTGVVTLTRTTTASGNVLSNVSGSTTTPSYNSISSVLDTIGGTQGDVLYRSGTGWAVLTPGTAGQVLSTGGPGTNPAWATVSGGGVVSSVSNSDGTLSISPTIGDVIASINLASANTWTGAITAPSFNATSATAPANGMYLASANTLAFSTNSILGLSINSSQKAIFAGAVQVDTLNSVGFVQTDSSGNLTTAAIHSNQLPYTAADMATYSMYGGF